VVSLHAVCRLPVIDGSPAYLQAEAASRLAGFLPTSELAALEGIGTGIIGSENPGVALVLFFA